MLLGSIILVSYLGVIGDSGAEAEEAEEAWERLGADSDGRLFLVGMYEAAALE